MLQWRRFPLRRWLVFLWLAWCGLLLLSALSTGNVTRYVSPLLLATIPVAYFTFVSDNWTDPQRINRFARIVLWLLGGAGAVVWVAGVIIGASQIPLGLLDDSGRLMMTVLEPNLFGCLIAFLILISLPHARARWRDVLLYGAATIALVGSLSKAPLIACAFGLIAYGLLRSIARRTSLAPAVLVPVWIALAGSAVLLTMLPSVLEVYDRAFARPEAIFARAYILDIALSRFAESPLIGRGPGDFGLQDVSLIEAVGARDASNLWISQMMVNILHDSGIVGLIIYLCFLLLLLLQGFRYVRSGSLPHCGYVAGMLSILVASQAATVHLSPIFGIAAGLVVARALPFARRPSPLRRRRPPGFRPFVAPAAARRLPQGR